MFDLGWSELLLVAAVALIVIGPKDLPQAVRTVTQLVRRLRGMAQEFQSSLDDLAREAGVDEIKKDLNEFKADYDPRAALEGIADGDREVSGTFDEPPDFSSGNTIEAPKAGERSEPPDLTPAEFGGPDGDPRSSAPEIETPVDEDRNDDAASSKRDGNTA